MGSMAILESTRVACSRRGRRSGLGVILSIVLLCADAPYAGQAPQAAGPAIDVAVFDRNGQPITNLSAADFQISIDGRIRAVTSARYVYRGPEAAARAVRAAERTGKPSFLERLRTVLIAVDERSVSRESEQAARGAALGVLRLLGPQERVALAALPANSDRISFSSDRQSLQAAAASVRGRAPLREADEEALLARPEPRGAEPESGRERKQPDLASAAASGDAPPRENSSVASLHRLARIISGLRHEVGVKHVAYVTTAASATGLGGGDEGLTLQAALAAVRQAAAASRTFVHLVVVPSAAGARISSPDLESMARGTGGVVAWTTEGGAGLERLDAAIGGGYRLEIAGSQGARDDRTHSLEVRLVSRRPDLLGISRQVMELSAPALWCPRDDPAPESLAPSSALASDKAIEVTLSKAGSKGGKRAPAGSVPDPELAPLLARVTAYLGDYLAAFSNVVAAEDYVQVVKRPPTGDSFTGPFSLRRRLLSDLMLLRVEGPNVWMPFRDVHVVDGRRVSDREDRLRILFLEEPGRALREARRITEESSRYNIGSVYRTVNLPTIPLIFLMPAHVGNFSFTRRGEEAIGSAPSLRLDYQEIGRPTVLRRASSYEDMPAEGSLWIDTATGRVLRTRIAMIDKAFSMESVVDYAPSDALGIWVPATMTEKYVQGSEVITGVARYDNFRRFQVTTEETIKVPKDQ